jgi:hypothetical protein
MPLVRSVGSSRNWRCEHRRETRYVVPGNT